MKMRISSYWTIVLRRIVDYLALLLQFIVRNLVNKEFQKEIVAEMVDSRSDSGGGLNRLMEESPSVASKREKQNNSINLLKDSKDAVAAIVDQNSRYGDRYILIDFIGTTVLMSPIFSASEAE